MAPKTQFSIPPVVCFTGWHNSGKTTLASQVVTALTSRGYRVAVIKSTKETGLTPDPPATDTARYARAGADSVALLAPDQLILRSGPRGSDLPSLAYRYFRDMDLVIAEGFKQADGVDKIEVRHNEDAPLLRGQVPGIVAVAANHALTDGLVFRLDQVTAITDFLVARFLAGPESGAQWVHAVANGRPIPLPKTLQEQLTALLRPCLDSLAPTGETATLELTLRSAPQDKRIP
ncbi:molybdopterin-guanine dinucleotide biosynthesis protein B [Desulfobulbus alkaliphilus]|uniref:molybdopterin-guanine dinucleotide biosynthesis protein B n=1 Tax=Desulfobulbus alkaliphilus TaxID=869814 RepID=UPI0019654111|nr:molybdopterin-guanine dinucleotide biosynthesis protein B [Desulfobulbus alkaliphilus]MBM9535584.1 molybdopterin-guanine dinucleotide biosynthesis protein B [Desulfobulbus alkaliphilus]